MWGFEWGIYSCNVRVYVHTYMYVTLRNVNLHSFALTCTYAQELMRHVHWRCWCQWRTRKNSASWHWRREGQCFWPSATYVFCAVECWTQPMVGDTEKEKATNKVNVHEGKKRTRESVKEISTLWRVFTCKPGINYAFFHVRFNRSPSWAWTK